MIDTNLDEAIGIYWIVSPNGSCYVGATAKSFRVRWDSHLKDFRLNRMKCRGLERAFRKYGADKMAWSVLELIPRSAESSIWTREQFWWDLLSGEGMSIYNARPTGTGSVHHSALTKRRISESVLASALLRKPERQCICAYVKCSQSFIIRSGREKDSQRGKYCSRSCYLLDKSTGITKDLLLEMVADHKSVKEIAAYFDCSLNEVYKSLRKYEISRN